MRLWATVCNFTLHRFFEGLSQNCRNFYFAEKVFGDCFCYQIKIADIMNPLVAASVIR